MHIFQTDQTVVKILSGDTIQTRARKAMDAVGLHLNIDYVGGSGSILTPEQKAALQTSLVILQSENKFHRVYFWGKIYGARYNYYIAQGVYQDEFRGRTAFYRFMLDSTPLCGNSSLLAHTGIHALACASHARTHARTHTHTHTHTYPRTHVRTFTYCAYIYC